MVGVGIALLEGGLAGLEAVLQRHAVVVVVKVLEGFEDFLIVTLAKQEKGFVKNQMTGKLKTGIFSKNSNFLHLGPGEKITFYSFFLS